MHTLEVLVKELLKQLTKIDDLEEETQIHDMLIIFCEHNNLYSLVCVCVCARIRENSLCLFAYFY